MTLWEHETMACWDYGFIKLLIRLQDYEITGLLGLWG